MHQSWIKCIILIIRDGLQNASYKHIGQGKLVFTVADCFFTYFSFQMMSTCMLQVSQQIKYTSMI